MIPSEPMGMSCPVCSGYIPLSVEQLLKADNIVCPHCGLRLHVDRQKLGTGDKKSPNPGVYRRIQNVSCL